jgi:hypothetical protein
MKKWLYFCDLMGDADVELEDIKRELSDLQRESSCPKFKIPEIEITTLPPSQINFDVLFFDWGGMSIGNSLLDHFCEHFIDDAREHPSRIYIMTSYFTMRAMEDALRYLDREKSEIPKNIFLTIDDAMPYLKDYAG